MYIKGGSRRSIGFWSKHLQDREQNLRVDIIERRGLAATDLKDMMLEMQEDARFTRCENFMYIAAFNPCPHEQLTEEQWEKAYEIFEKHRGIPAGQQRIVIEHEKEGRIHRHVVWNRVDLENMRAFRDAWNSEVCAEAKVEIEQELKLERTPGLRERQPGDPRPLKAFEMHRGMKSGLDPRLITAEVTQIYRDSRNGADFVEGLVQHGYQLAEGRRGLCILDGAGHEHSLARRIEGVNAKELRAFMQGVDLGNLPTVEQARAQFRDRKISDLEADRDTVRHEIVWLEALAKAAIEKEKIEQRFVEPRPERNKGQDDREKIWPIEPPKPERIRTSPEFHFGDAAREATRGEPQPPMPEKLRGTPAEIWNAYHQSDNARAFAAALDEQGISLAVVTKSEADRSHRNAEFARAAGNYAPRFKEGEIVAIAEPGLTYRDGKIAEPRVYRLDKFTTGEEPRKVEAFLKPLDRSQLEGIEATQEKIKARVEQRIIEVQAFRDLLRDVKNDERMKQAQAPGRTQPIGALKRGARSVVTKALAAPRLAEKPVGSAFKLLGAAGKLADGLFDLIDPVLTPALKREKEIMARTREAEAENTTDLQKYAAERRRQEEERPKEREPDRDRGRER